MIYYPRPAFLPKSALYSINIYHFEGVQTPLSPSPPLSRSALWALALPLICPAPGGSGSGWSAEQTPYCSRPGERGSPEPRAGNEGLPLSMEEWRCVCGGGWCPVLPHCPRHGPWMAAMKIYGFNQALTGKDSN